MGIKERRKKIIFSLFFIKDIEESPVFFTEEIQKIFDISLNAKGKDTIGDLVEQGTIFKFEENSQVSYQLSNSGYEELSLEFPFCRFLRDNWDGKWRIVSYEIPEKQRDLRDKLRREVSSWGLGPWHRSFWITPHPIIPYLQKLVANKEEEKYIQAFDSDHVFGMKEVLINKVWDLKSLEVSYKNLFKNWHNILATENSNDKKFSLIVSEYIKILRTDPGLPKEILDERWIGFEAFAIFKDIRKILLKTK